MFSNAYRFIKLSTITIVGQILIFVILYYCVSQGWLIRSVKSFNVLSSQEVWFFYLLGPLMEELIFRLPLRKSRWNFTVFSFCFFSWISFFFTKNVIAQFAAGSSISILVYFLFRIDKLRLELRRIYDTMFIPICILSICSFALIHLPSSFGYEFFHLLPILFGAILLTKVRISLNIWYAIVLHILMNVSLQVFFLHFNVIFGVVV